MSGNSLSGKKIAEMGSNGSNFRQLLVSQSINHVCWYDWYRPYMAYMTSKSLLRILRASDSALDRINFLLT